MIEEVLLSSVGSGAVSGFRLGDVLVFRASPALLRGIDKALDKHFYVVETIMTEALAETTIADILK